MNKRHLLYNINMEPNTLHTLLANLQDVHCDNLHDMHCDIWSCKGLVVGLFLYKVFLQTNVNTCRYILIVHVRIYRHAHTPLRLQNICFRFYAVANQYNPGRLSLTSQTL